MSDGPDHQLYAQAKSILQRVFEIPPAERGAYLESACGNHPELRAEVFSLLAAHEQASGGFLDSPFTLQDGEVETGADPEDRDLTGQRVGAYRLERLLGRGGMGAVYLASRDDGEFKKHVAIKFIRSSAATPSLLRRFRAERQILADIDHPNIARLIDGGTADGMPFFIMEYVPGETLTQVLGQGPLPLARVLLLATAVADVLEAVHAKNMVFRDLKPSNIMLTEQSGVKVLDFGIAKITRDESGEHTTALTESGWIVGSPRYMSPEQASGETVDARSDVFSFGVVVFEALIGRLPFSGESRQEYFKNLITTAAEPLPVVMPEGLRAIVERCLRKSPADRFASGKELAFAMREVVARLDGRRSNSRTVWAALALLAVTIAVGLWAAFKPGASAALLTDRPELIVTWASNETNPRISPDLHWLSFQTDRDGATKIVLRELASGLERTITPLGGEAFGHEWSPASDQIAYLAPSGHETSVTLAPLDDSKPHVFLLRHGQATLVRWIGSGIYYLADGSLWRLDLTSGQSHEITTRRGTLRIREVDVSADEGHLVFTAMKASVSTVFSSGMDGSNPLQLTHDRMDPKSIRFRGVRATEVVYVSEEGGMVDIWKLDLASGKRDRLTMTDTREGDIEVSRDGNTLVYEQVRERANLALLEPGAKTPALRMLTSDSLSDLLPSASSSGNVIAFQRAKTLDMSLGLQSATIHVSRDGLATSSAKLTDGYTPEVSADGRWVASAILKPAAQAELWMTDVDTGKRIPVSNDLLRINYSPFPLQRIGATMAWSPSETSLFFLSKDTVRGTEVKRATPSADGQTVDVQQVTNINDVAATVSDVRVLADGSGLSYLLRLDAPVVTELRLRIFARKEETVSFREASSLRLDCPGWTTNGDALVIRWATDTGRADVVLVKSGKAVEIARGLQDTTRGSFTLDPARRVVYFTRQRGTVHSLYSMKLDSGIESLVFQGEPYGPSLSGIRVLADGRLLFSLQAQNHDIVTNKYGR